MIPSTGCGQVKEHAKGNCAMGVNSTVDLELLEEIYWAQRKISQVGEGVIQSGWVEWGY